MKHSSTSRTRYRRWAGDPDPLAPPFDPASALRRIADDVMAGVSPRTALRELLRHGDERRPGLDELQRRVAQRRQELLQRHDLGGTLRQARELLDHALLAERKQLARDLDDDARFAELQLDAVPPGLAAAVRELSPYQWRSSEAREAYREVGDLVGRELLDQRFAGMKQALEQAGPAEREAVRQMLQDLNDLLAAHARGEDTTDAFAEFMARHGDQFPEQPGSVDELIDALAARAAAAARMRHSLSPEQREELDALAQQAFGSAELMDQLGELDARLQQLRPGQDWTGSAEFTGDEPLGWGEAAGVLQQLAELDELGDQLAQQYPGASLSDIDLELLDEVLGSDARVDAEALRQLERELTAQGLFHSGPDGALQLSPRALRQLGQALLRDVDQRLGRQRGLRESRRHGAGGEPTGASVGWQFGDHRPWDVPRTLHNATIRRATTGGGPALQLDDVEVVDTEARGRAAVALLVDTSFSMAVEGRWVPMKRTALALHHLVSTRYRGDALELIMFGRVARRTGASALTGLPPHHEQGTNLHHALLLANQFFTREPATQPVLLVVTDGEPTAHLEPDGEPVFDYPPTPETLHRTVTELDLAAQRGTRTTFFRLGDDPGLERFLDALAHRCGGSVVAPPVDDLDAAVVASYLRGADHLPPL